MARNLNRKVVEGERLKGMKRKETKTSSLPSHPAVSGNSSWVISKGSYCQWWRYLGVNYGKDLRQDFHH